MRVRVKKTNPKENKSYISEWDPRMKFINENFRTERKNKSPYNMI